MTTVSEFLAERGITLDEQRLVEALDELLAPHLQAGDPAVLTEAEEAVLSAHGGVHPVPGAGERAAARAVAAAAELVTGPSTGELAERLGIDASRIRHRAAEGSLHAVRVGRENRYPSWQFGPDGRPLPGLREVLAAAPEDLHPLELAGFATTPAPELTVAGEALSPAAWLAGGGTVEPVVELAAALAEPA